MRTIESIRAKWSGGPSSDFAEDVRFLLAEIDAQRKAVMVTEWVWANCRIVYAGHLSEAYPLEHAPLARKNMRLEIEAVAREAISNLTPELAPPPAVLPQARLPDARCLMPDA